MKKILLMGLMVVSLSVLTAGIYDPNNTVTQPEDKELKATAVPLSQGSDYRLDFIQMDGRCGAAEADNVSIGHRNVSPGNNTLVVEGVFQTPHPKYNLTSEVRKTGDNLYEMKIEGVESSKVAPRCIGNVNYHAHFTAPQNSTLKVLHNQTVVGEKQISEDPSTGAEKSQKDGQDNEKEAEGSATVLDKILNLF
ncbi:hypothetical protein [Candidatus Nanohalobium constans]|uniref:Uncharacterized protein n=1 Tax=Candidatus Nanohalobium constans TaxID=2565781 RepID=A0A5Q0UI95_9ARCH|nr:hypothetical protein [Candidatus Nanohalobium constans]QGA80900.1 hypothetical protein LC1Nh_1026 [Candidatus Nanohalobium constans]